MHYLSRIVVLLACVSCAHANDPSLTPPAPGKRPKIGITLVGSQIRRGESIRVAVHINNHGQAPHRLEFATGCQLTWTITAADGQAVTTRCMICTQAPTSIMLAGNLYETTATVPTKRLCELPWPFTDDTLPVGHYTLTFYAIGYEDQFVCEPVPFEIVE
jgi:hypothetical protein